MTMGECVPTRSMICFKRTRSLWLLTKKALSVLPMTLSSTLCQRMSFSLRCVPSGPMGLDRQPVSLLIA